MLKKITGKVFFQFLLCLTLTFCSTGALALDTGFIPAANRVDMVYDDAREILYITSGPSVLRYSMTSKSFLTPYTFNLGHLYGIDLSPDGTTLAVADANITGIHLIDLGSDTIKPDLLFTPSSGESGTFSVAFGADGALLVSSRFNGSGWVPLRRVDPATGEISVIESMIRQDAMLSASGNRACIAYEESNISSGPVSIYDVASKSVTGSVDTDWFTYEVGANRNCSQFAVPTYGGTFIYDGALNKTGTLGVYAGAQPIGVAYHPGQDIVYFAWTGSSKVRAYDSNTAQLLTSYDVGYLFDHTGNSAFTQGRLRTSRDGALLFATVAGGIYSVRTALNPVVNDLQVGTKSAAPMTILLTGSSPIGAQLSYSIASQPAHGTLQGTPPNLTYTPQANFSGRDSFSYKASDGTLESQPGTVSITIDQEPPEVTAFALPQSVTSLTVPVTGFSATDNETVSGYCLRESASPTGCQWSATPPASYRFSTMGVHTLYAFAIDAVANVSAPASAAVNIPELVPRITQFSIPSSYAYSNLTVAVTLTVNNDLPVTGYCLSESAQQADCSWTSSPPQSYSFSEAGPHTLYAFARNSAGKVSAPASASTNVVGASNFIPAAGRVDTVYDSARGLVYISEGSSVLRYQVSTQTFLTPYSFGFGNLAGLDISPDGNTLAVADRSINGIHLVDLSSATVKPDLLFTPSTGESGTYSVAFGADGALLVSSRFSGSGWVPLRRIDPVTGEISVIESMIRQDAMLSASGDRRCIAFEESNISSGPVSIYDVASKSVTGSVDTDWFTYEVGANRDCSQFAVPTYGGTFIYNSGLTKIGALGVYAGSQPIGVAYSPVADLVYFAWTGTREVRAYDTTNYQQVASYDMGYIFQHNGNNAYENGRLKVARDGSLFLVTVQGGVRYQRVSSGGAPVADDQAVIAYSGYPIAVNLSGSNPGQSSLSYSITSHPSHGTLEGTAPNLIYSSTAGYTGPDSFTFLVSDGTVQGNLASFAISVKAVPTDVAIAPPAVKGALSLSWTNPSDPGFTHIHIYRSTAAGTLGTRIVDNLIANHYTDTGLAPLTTYYYTVRWVDLTGRESNNADQVSQRTLDATPPVTQATPGQGQYRAAQNVTLSCNDGDGNGCAATYYCLGVNCTPGTTYQNAIPIASSNILRFYSADKAGNSEAVKSLSYQIEPRYITLSPANLNMGAAPLSYPVSQTVTIGNAGSLPLSVSALQLSGLNSALFSVTPGGATPCSSLAPTLAAGQSCTLKLTFTPESAGPKQAFLQVTSNADNAPDLVASLTGVAAPPVYLTTQITGAGTINNIAQSAAFSCGAPSCSAPFGAGSYLTLRATASSGHTFSGWSGQGCSGTGDCELTLSSNTTVAALFEPQRFVRLNGGSTSYPNFSAALQDVLDQGLLRSRDVVITDNIYLTGAKRITLVGGLKDDFATAQGVTVLDGTITIRQGSLRVKNLVVR